MSDENHELLDALDNIARELQLLRKAVNDARRERIATALMAAMVGSSDEYESFEALARRGVIAADALIAKLD